MPGMRQLRRLTYIQSHLIKQHSVSTHLQARVQLLQLQVAAGVIAVVVRVKHIVEGPAPAVLHYVFPWRLQRRGRNSAHTPGVLPTAQHTQHAAARQLGGHLSGSAQGAQAGAAAKPLLCWQSVHSAVHSPLLQRVSDWCHFSGVDDGCQARGWLANEPHIAAAIDCSSVNKLQWVMV